MTDAFDRANEVQAYMSGQNITTSQLDLLNVIHAVVDDRDDLQDPADAEPIVRKAFNHFVEHGGVDYDTAVGELLYSTVRDRVTDAMEPFLPPDISQPAFWVVFEREPLDTSDPDLPDLYVGPFPNLLASAYALNESLLIEDLCTDKHLDYVITDVVAPEKPFAPEVDGDNIIVIDPKDPDHDPYSNQELTLRRKS